MWPRQTHRVFLSHWQTSGMTDVACNFTRIRKAFLDMQGSCLIYDIVVHNVPARYLEIEVSKKKKVLVTINEICGNREGSPYKLSRSSGQSIHCLL
jgi:hypothetical protein